jgi:hypothetical protein
MISLLPQLRKYLPWFLLAELVSYLGYYWPTVNSIGFLACASVAVFFAFRNYDYLVALLLAELVIGSKGHLFVLAIGNFSLSVRMVLWLIVMAAWFVHVLISLWRAKDFKPSLREALVPQAAKVFLPLLFFVLLAAGLALLNGNGLANIYADANAWLYFLLIWPFGMVLKKLNQEKLGFYGGVVATAIVWLVIKTWLILYFFSHDFAIIGDFYKWVRDSGVGEITAMKGSFYRIFIQSHLYPLAALVIIWFYLAKEVFAGARLRALMNSKPFIYAVLVSSALLSVILIGLSRSFWVGLLAALGAICLISLFGKKQRLGIKLQRFAYFFGTLGASFVIALFIILLIIKIPVPRNTLEFDATSVLSERATETSESAIGSRWAMLPVLAKEISKHPLIGSGFGKTVTYRSEDPRVVAATGGIYTTYAFEWGWLDMWLKFGLFGLLAYIYLLYAVWQKAAETAYIWPIRLVLVALATLHVFTPYLNHPLGIGLLLMVAFLEMGIAGVLPKRRIFPILHVLKLNLLKNKDL